MPPHSVVLSFIGACLLWVGWFGFNAGSALAANSLATSAFVVRYAGWRLSVLGAAFEFLLAIRRPDGSIHIWSSAPMERSSACSTPSTCSAPGFAWTRGNGS